MIDPTVHFKPVAWFRQVWPFRTRRWAVITEYAALRQSPHLLADIALRGGVYGSLARSPGDVFGDGINEGRRQLANEILSLAKQDPGELYAIIERKPVSKGEGQ
jgi:hypothetical protein